LRRGGWRAPGGAAVRRRAGGWWSGGPWVLRRAGMWVLATRSWIIHDRIVDHPRTNSRIIAKPTGRKTGPLDPPASAPSPQPCKSSRYREPSRERQWRRTLDFIADCAVLADGRVVVRSGSVDRTNHRPLELFGTDGELERSWLLAPAREHGWHAAI